MLSAMMWRGLVLRQTLRSVVPRYLSVALAPESASRTMEGIFEGEPFNAADYHMFPKEGGGHDYSLNWSMSELGIQVHNRCWRNPCRGELLKALKQSWTTEGAVVCPREDKPESEVDSVSGASLSSLSEATKQFLSDVSDLYVVDGSMGSCRLGAERTRIVTNDPATCWIMKNLLEPAPESPQANPVSIAAFLARTNEVCCCGTGKESDLPLQSTYAAGWIGVDRIMSVGAHPVSELVKAYSSVPSKTKRVVMRGHLLSAQGATSLILGSPKLVQLATEANCLYSAHHTILGEGYACKVWRGSVQPYAPGQALQKSDFCDGKVVYSSLDQENAADLPSTILLVNESKDPNTMSEVSYDGVPKLLEEQQYSPEEIQSLMDIMKLGNIEFFVAGTTTVKQAISSLKH